MTTPARRAVSAYSYVGMQSDWLRSRMAELGLSQAAIGKVLSRDRSQVSRIIAGKQVLKLGEIEPLADVLRVTPLELIRRAWDWRDTEIVRLAHAWERVPHDRRQQAIRLVETFAPDASQPAREAVPTPAKRGRRSYVFAPKTRRPRSVRVSRK